MNAYIIPHTGEEVNAATREDTREMSNEEYRLRLRIDQANYMNWKMRWSAPCKARVIHPKYGEIIVPCASKLSAIMCAAEVWLCSDMDITDARVMLADQDAEVVKPQYI